MRPLAIGEDWNASSVNTTQVPINKRIERVGCSMMKNSNTMKNASKKTKSELNHFVISGVPYHVQSKGF
jgi:hypothetical protein